MRKIAGVILLFLLCMGVVISPGAALANPLRSFEKDLGHLSDEILRGMDSNVLIFMDITNPMVMSLSGQLPVFRWQLNADGSFSTNPDHGWMLANQPMMRDANFRAGLMAQNTFGTGTRPLSTATLAQQAARLNNTNLPAGQIFAPPFVGTERPNWGPGGSTAVLHAGTRWGRDVNPMNNIIGHPDMYYSPDPARPFLLTFKDYNWANWSGVGPIPNSAPDYVVGRVWIGPGTPHFPAGANIPQENFGNRPMPAGLQRHLPGGSHYGLPVTDPMYFRHLVPNDSKMYQVKLVLWRLLSPTQDNLHMLSRMRLGLGTTYHENSFSNTGQPPPSVLASMLLPGVQFGVSPSVQVWHSTSNATPLAATNINHPHGRADGIAQGAIAHGNPSMQVTSTGGVISTYRSTERGPRHAGRSILRVPFDFMYTRGSDGSFVPTQSLITFRELIDGIEQVDNSPNVAFHDRFVNMELTPTALVNTAERSMFGRGSRGDNWLTNAAGVPWPVRHQNRPGSPAVTHVTGWPNAIMYNTGPRGHRATLGSMNTAEGGLIMRRVETSEGFMSGTVVGDVLDFFSPNNILPFTTGQADGTGDTRGFFPVTGACQNNWIIYFSTGNEGFPGWTGGPEETGANRSMMRTLMDIHYASQVLRGRHWNGTNWVEANHVMDNPIRTIVVGLVSTEGIENDGNNPFAPNDPNNVPRNLRNSIRRMAQAGQPLVTRDAQGRIASMEPNPNIQPIFAANTEELIMGLYAALYAIQSGNLSSGAPNIPQDVEVDGLPVMLSSSYVIDPSGQWRGSLTKRLIDVTATPPSVPAPLWMAHGGGPNADAGLIMYAHRGTRADRLWTVDGNNTVTMGSFGHGQFRNLFNIPNHHPHPDTSNTFRQWLIDYEGDGSGILGDSENSAPVVVTRTAMYSGPAYGRIYLQTNRGVLHRINLLTGLEEWAFIPPMVQTQVRDKRFTDAGQVFLNNNVERRSRAMRILDGMLAHLCVTGGASPRTLLMGAMGSSGAGFYMMDITDPNRAQPYFLWAVANPRYATPTTGAQVLRWGSATSAPDGDFVHYTYLGFTIAAPEIRRVGVPSGSPTAPRYVGIIPGGLGYNLGVNDNQGKAFLFFNVNDGRIINAIRGGNGFIPPPGGGEMGMGIAPIYYIVNRDVYQTVREIFTNDSEGNIMRSGVVNDGAGEALDVNNWTLRPFFRTRNLEGPDGPVIMPLSFATGVHRGQRWLFAGTSNLSVPDGRELRNDEQYIFVLNLNSHQAFNDSQLAPTVPVRTLADLGNIQREHNSDDALDPPDNTGPFDGANDLGWRLRLRPAVGGPGIDSPRDPEYTSVTPFLFNGVLYVATFTPHTWLPDGDRERCAATGDGRLYALDPRTGASRWPSGAQSLLLENIKIVGLGSHEGGLVVEVALMVGGDLQSIVDGHQDFDGGQLLSPNTFWFPPPGGGGEPPPDWEPNVPHPLFWREVIR